MARLTQQAKSENRQRLLDAAAAEFARRGLEEANINEISLAAGFAKGTVYNHFDSKEALFLAVVEEACELAAAGALRRRRRGADPGAAARRAGRRTSSGPAPTRPSRGCWCARC